MAFLAFCRPRCVPARPSSVVDGRSRRVLLVSMSHVALAAIISPGAPTAIATHPARVYNLRSGGAHPLLALLNSDGSLAQNPPRLHRSARHNHLTKTPLGWPAAAWRNDHGPPERVPGR